MKIDGLRSPYVLTRGLAYFARMVDKIRLNAAGKLPPDYVENLGGGFDERCLNFLGIRYEDLTARVLSEGGSDEDLLEWALAHGSHPNEEQIEIWTEFMRKRGWNDVATERVLFRLKEAGLEHRTDIVTMFDFIDLDEGRDPAEK